MVEFRAPFSNFDLNRSVVHKDDGDVQKPIELDVSHFSVFESEASSLNISTVSGKRKQKRIKI